MIARLLFLLLSILLCQNAISQVPGVGIGTNMPQAMMHVDSGAVLFNGGVVLPGTPDDPPASGAGVRMMWYPEKAAFRAGNVASTQWNKENIGNNSIALGLNVRASGVSAVALGSGNVSSGPSSTTLGTNNVASGDYSLATGAGTDATGTHSISGGYISQASGDYSFAFGWQSEATSPYSFAVGFGASATGVSSTSLGSSTTADGFASTALGYATQALSWASLACGYRTQAHGYSSLVAGLYNDPIVAIQNAVTSTTPLFIIGNGENDTTRSNALTVLKNGRIGVGDTSPDALLHVKNGTGGGMYNGSTSVIFEDDINSYIQFSYPTGFETGFLYGNSSSAIRSALIFSANGGVDLRAGGNTNRLRVESDGDIYMYSGEVHREPTSTAHLLPICYGSVSSGAVINSGSGNFSVASNGTGRYDITIDNETYSTTGYVTSVTVTGVSPRMWTTSADTGDLVVFIYDGSGNDVNATFHFVVYKQ